MDINGKRIQWLLPAFVIVLTACLFYPSLDSDFMLDDYANLNRLDEITAKGYAYFIFGGISGASGRPLSLATFALQHDAWPANPFAFKFVNLSIHLINGLLIFVIVRVLLKKLNFPDRDVYWMSLIALGLWLIHPVQISTVLYAVQRMAQLSTLMILAGIGGYLYFREQYRQTGDPIRLFFAGVVIAAMMILGILAKENGILLPLYIIVIEFIFFSDNKNKNGVYKAWYWFFLIAPLLLLILYFGYTFDRIVAGFDKRPFTMYERLLTEAVILFDYMQSILIPRPDTFSVYHDDYQHVHGLFSPVYAFAAVVGVFALLAIAVGYRKKFHLVSFAILWFFAGHSLESSFLGLELYFEHRNYLPSLGIFVLLGWLMVAGYRKARSGLVAGSLAGAYILAVVIVSVMILHLWANPVLQAARWAQVKPDSLRAQTNLADMYLVNEQYDKSEEVYIHLKSTRPDVLFPYLKELLIKGCVKKEALDNAYWNQLYETAVDAKYDNYASLSTLDDIVINLNRGHCDSVEPANIARVMLILAGNPEYRAYRWVFHELIAYISVFMGDARAALNNINRSIELKEYPNNLYFKVRIMLMMEDYDAADSALNEFTDHLDGNPAKKLAYLTIVHDFQEEINQGKRDASY